MYCSLVSFAKLHTNTTLIKADDDDDDDVRNDGNDVRPFAPQ